MVSRTEPRAALISQVAPLDLGPFQFIFDLLPNLMGSNSQLSVARDEPVFEFSSLSMLRVSELPVKMIQYHITPHLQSYTLPMQIPTSCLGSRLRGIMIRLHVYSRGDVT